MGSFRGHQRAFLLAAHGQFLLAIDIRALPGKGYTVPFIGLAEVYVLNAFRKAGLPMQRIRPAVEVLAREIGLEHALANNQLVTDGAEILYDSRDPDDRRLIVVRNGDAVFNEIVSDYL